MINSPLRQRMYVERIITYLTTLIFSDGNKKRWPASEQCQRQAIDIINQSKEKVRQTCIFDGGVARG